MLIKIKKLKLLVKTYGFKGVVKNLKMRLSVPIKDYNQIEHYFNNKTGLEIGGPSWFFKHKIPIYKKVLSLDGINFSKSTIWTGEIDEQSGFLIDGIRVGKQYILDAVNLDAIKNNSYDFVLSCNNIEHIANPLKAIEEWLSVLNKGGVLVMIAPRKETNFDHNRDIVKFEHLLLDYQNKINEGDLTHLEEILKLHDLKMDPPSGTPDQFKERSCNNFENRCLHHHVFDQNVLTEIFNYFNLGIIKNYQLESDYIIIGQKK